MPQIETTIGFTELIGYAQDEGIATWNDACDIIRSLYPEDGEGFRYIEPQDYEEGHYGDPESKLVQIVVGFAKKYEEEYKTYSNGFKAIVE